MFPTTDKQLTCLVGALTFKQLSQDMWRVCVYYIGGKSEYKPFACENP